MTARRPRPGRQWVLPPGVKSFLDRHVGGSPMMLQESELIATRGAQRPQLHPELQHGTKGVNVSTGEWALSVAVGLGMVAYRLRRRTVPALLVSLVGGSILHRGLTGRSRALALMGMTEVPGEQPGVAFELSTTILKP